MTRKDAWRHTEPNPLVAITGKADDLRRYETVMQTVAGRRQRNQDGLSTLLDTMEQIVDDQLNRLAGAVETYGLTQPSLQVRVAHALELLRHLKGRVQRLQLACRHCEDGHVAEQLQEAIEAIRHQIAYAMEVQFG